MAVKRHHDHCNSYKGKPLTGSGLQFRGLAVYCRKWQEAWQHAGRHGVERLLRVLHLDLQAAGSDGDTLGQT